VRQVKDDLRSAHLDAFAHQAVHRLHVARLELAGDVHPHLRQDSAQGDRQERVLPRRVSDWRGDGLAALLLDQPWRCPGPGSAVVDPSRYPSHPAAARAPRDAGSRAASARWSNCCGSRAPFGASSEREPSRRVLTTPPVSRGAGSRDPTLRGLCFARPGQRLTGRPLPLGSEGVGGITQLAQQQQGARSRAVLGASTA